MKERHVEVKVGVRRKDRRTVVVEYSSRKLVQEPAEFPLQVEGRTYTAADDDLRRDDRADKTRLTVPLKELAQVSSVRRTVVNKRSF